MTDDLFQQWTPTEALGLPFGTSLLWPRRDKLNAASLIATDWLNHKHLYLNGSPHKNLVVQAGGCCGLYPMLFAQQYARVITFEPDPINFFCLAHNCKGNKIVKFNAALSNVGGWHDMYLFEENIGMNRLTQPGQDTVPGTHVKIYAMQLDALELPECDLIQLDLEGYEYFALLGAAQTINKFRPPIFLELSDNKDKIIEFMHNHDYIDLGTLGWDHYYVPKEKISNATVEMSKEMADSSQL